MTSALYIVARTVLLDALEALSAQHDAIVLRGNDDGFRIVNAVLARSQELGRDNEFVSHGG